MSKTSVRPLVTIVGPTASGKTSLSVRLAEYFDGEIVSADSRQVYRGLDIMSGKISPEEQARIPHYLIDEVEPWESFSAAEFKIRAVNYMKSMWERKKLSFVVGGTGLYVTGVVYDYDFASTPADTGLRSELQTYSLEELQEKLNTLSTELELSSDDWQNRYRLIRSIEIAYQKTWAEKNEESPYNFVQIGLYMPREMLREKIAARVEARLEAGVVEEIETLYERIQRQIGAEQAEKQIVSFGLGSKAVWEYINENLSYEEMKERFIRAEYQYAKRQMTWFRRDSSIHWVRADERPFEEAKEIIGPVVTDSKKE